MVLEREGIKKIIEAHPQYMEEIGKVGGSLLAWLDRGVMVPASVFNPASLHRILAKSGSGLVSELSRIKSDSG